MENNTEIKEQDVVWLISGSPKMAIARIAEYSGIKKATCIWFENGKKHEELYEVSILTSENPDTAGFVFGSIERV